MSATANLGFKASSRSVAIALALIGVGAVAAGWGLSVAPERTWPSLFLNGFYIASIAVSAIFFFATQRATSARWSANLRRVPEALMLAMPVASLLLLALFIGRKYLFPWTHAGVFDHVPAFAGKIQYLQARWVVARVATALLLWNLFALLIRRASLAQDRKPGMNLVLHHRLTQYAVLFIPVFAVTFSMSAFDWLISLEPGWFSTMFAVYVFAGTFVQGIAGVTLATVILKERGPFSSVIQGRQLHDLGKMLFAFSTFWAYIWTAQYLLIWYGNIPEEVTHFVARTNGPWLYLFLLNLIANWVAPFILLLSAKDKHSVRRLAIVSLVLLFGHWLDLYMLIMPAEWRAPRFGPLELAITAGYLALLYLLFVRALGRAPLVPVNDPVLRYEELGRTPVLVHGMTGAKQ